MFCTQSNEKCIVNVFTLFYPPRTEIKLNIIQTKHLRIHVYIDFCELFQKHSLSLFLHARTGLLDAHLSVSEFIFRERIVRIGNSAFYKHSVEVYCLQLLLVQIPVSCPIRNTNYKSFASLSNVLASTVVCWEMFVSLFSLVSG